jgi:predicted transcriptional regulator
MPGWPIASVGYEEAAMFIGDLPETSSVRFKVLDERSSVRAAADAFSESQLGLIVICDGSGKAVGVVSKSDLVRHLARAGHVDVPIPEVMTRTLISASPGDDLRRTWKFMVSRRLQNLPLLGAHGKPVGTLDIRDALQAIIRLEEDQEDELVNYIAGVGYR